MWKSLKIIVFFPTRVVSYIDFIFEKINQQREGRDRRVSVQRPFLFVFWLLFSKAVRSGKERTGHGRNKYNFIIISINNRKRISSTPTGEGCFLLSEHKHTASNFHVLEFKIQFPRCRRRLLAWPFGVFRVFVLASYRNNNTLVTPHRRCACLSTVFRVNGRTHQDRTRTKTDGANVKALDLVYLSCEIVRVALRLWKTYYVCVCVCVYAFILFFPNVCFRPCFFRCKFHSDKRVRLAGQIRGHARWPVSFIRGFVLFPPVFRRYVWKTEYFANVRVTKKKKNPVPHQLAFRMQHWAFSRDRKKRRNVIKRLTIRLHSKFIRYVDRRKTRVVSRS